ncbi:PD40 domain-containing protein [Crocinitomix catalasitica]|nr:PD40 domain-containing protein [Crocinitomix catalasitica]
MKLTIYISILIFTLGLNTRAQEITPKKELKVGIKAQKALNEFDYAKVIELYEDLVHGSIKSQRNLATANWKLGNLPHAQRAYQRIMDMKDRGAKDILNYALLLRQLGEYDESIELMKKYSTEAKDDPFVNSYLEDPKAHEKLLDTNYQFELTNIPYNTAHQDFGATYFSDDGIVFSSSRQSFKSVKRTYNSNSLPFLDIYEANIYDSTHNFIYPRIFDKTVNSKRHDGPATFNYNSSVMIFTSNSAKKNKDGFYTLNLYWSKYEGKSWTKPELMDINDSVGSTCHPSLSSDGTTIYFASDRAGGQGGYDIYRCKQESAGGTWGPAENLGNIVNTSGDEVFPFIHYNGGMLFYSSDGHVGLGALDIFAIQISEDGTGGSNFNLRSPINSNGNDFAFIMNKDQTRGYLSSNREGGKGRDDIYGITLNSPIMFQRYIKGLILDELGYPAGAINVILRNASGTILTSISTDLDGKFEFEVEENKEYKIEAGNTIYETVERHLTVNAMQGEIKLQIRMQKK